jgi:hypothetical protein
VVVVAVIAYILWRKRHSCRGKLPEKQVTTTDKQAVVANDSINNNDTNDHSGAFSRATVTDNPRRNSSDRKSGSMLIAMDSGTITDSVHDVTSSINDDIEHGTAGISGIDSDGVKGVGVVEQATSKTTAATATVDDNAATNVTQYKTSVPNEIDVTATTDGVTNDTMIATDAGSGNATHMNATTATTDASDIDTRNCRALAVQPASNEAAATGSSESATVAKKPLWTNKVAQAIRLVTDPMNTATQKAVAAHGDKAIVAYELVGAIAQHVPYIKTAYGLCNEVVQLFGAGVHIDSNCAEVVAWAKHMQVCYCMYVCMH